MRYRRYALLSTASVLTGRIDSLGTNDDWSDEYASSALVPVLSAIGGYLLLEEHITFAGAAATSLVVMGIVLARELALSKM
jgi:drug/metabolite transporter (DMT)-like permease